MLTRRPQWFLRLATIPPFILATPGVSGRVYYTDKFKTR